MKLPGPTKAALFDLLCEGQLTVGDCKVLACLLTHSKRHPNDRHWYVMSNAEITKNAGVHRNTLDKSLRNLEAKNIIKRKLFHNMKRQAFTEGGVDRGFKFNLKKLGLK